MALYKFTIEGTYGNSYEYNHMSTFYNSDFKNKFNLKCQELGANTVNYNDYNLIINDKTFKNFSYWQGIDATFYICDSYNYEFCLEVQNGRYSEYGQGGDNISQWPIIFEPSTTSVASSHSSCGYSQIMGVLNENSEPIIIGGLSTYQSFPTPPYTLDYDKTRQRLCRQPFITCFNMGGGLVNAFKDNEKVYLSKLFTTNNLDYTKIIKPKHLYVSKNLVDAGQKTIVAANGKEFINVGNIFYMEYNPIILNKTTWIPTEKEVTE